MIAESPYVGNLESICGTVWGHLGAFREVLKQRLLVARFDGTSYIKVWMMSAFRYPGASPSLQGMSVDRFGSPVCWGLIAWEVGKSPILSSGSGLPGTRVCFEALHTLNSKRKTSTLILILRCKSAGL